MLVIGYVQPTSQKTILRYLTDFKMSHDFAQVGSVKKKMRRDDSVENIDVTSFDVNNQNRFSILGKLEFLQPVQTIQQKTTINTHQTHSAATSTAAATEVVPRQKFCPPIFLFDQNINSLVAQLEAREPKIFKIKNVNRRKSKIFFADTAVQYTQK
ncbi:uncharacterized protein LOC142227600 [Haematobia irritans]|uniref:uncharacterized protein LOC142227600 n=1 Tax=Haematobia irritans TaxID=7368 RepID=UPI003F4F74C3